MARTLCSMRLSSSALSTVLRRDELAGAMLGLGHLAVEPVDELRRRHRVQFDAVGLQPFFPECRLGSSSVPASRRT